MDKLELQNRFTYHAPAGTQAERYEQCRFNAMALAFWIVEHTPESREQALAITKLEEVVFWANAAIARRENPSG